VIPSTAIAVPIETLLIRADANAEIGIGHVMRCVALAQAWRDAGGRVAFALAAGAKELGPRLRAGGADVLQVSAEPGAAEDAAQTAELCRKYKAQWLVLDGYHFSQEYRESVNPGTTRLLWVDDHGQCSRYKCDIVLNTSPYASDAMYPQREKRTCFLLGPKYALLRREFLDFPRRSPEVATTATRILITFGGSDSDNVTLLVLQALQEVSDVRLDITVVAGASNPHREALRDAAARSSHVARLLTDVDEMPDVMADADLAISAGGGTCYELAFMRVPMFLITIADNHERTVKAWGGARAAVAAGWFDEFVGKSMSVELRSLIGDSKLRRELVENASRMVDGRGAQRVVETMYTMYQEGTVAT
jgi:UDP-2,4-diacetamido-2,4,6-trideoxy-beta-L-altropyranose hydrolase